MSDPSNLDTNTARSLTGRHESSHDDLYADRHLRDGYPGLSRMADETFTSIHSQVLDEQRRIERLLVRLQRLAPLPTDARIVVVGCGPVPQPIAILRGLGYRAIGIEPVSYFVTKANEYLAEPNVVLIGAAEAIPLPDASQDVVLLESVLEHVDSPQDSLREVRRVLKPGGFVYITTTNRHRIGYPDNGEFTVPFFGKLPRLIKECYIFAHLHYQPSLARFTERPAVHWFTFAGLCSLGREVGFCEFYSSLDLRRASDQVSSSSPLLRFAARNLIRPFQRSPWLRALALVQLGGEIVMLKRPTLSVTTDSMTGSDPGKQGLDFAPASNE